MIPKNIVLICAIFALHFTCANSKEKPEEWASPDSNGNAIAVLKAEGKYHVSWYKNGKSIKGQSLDESPTNVLISKKNNLIVLAYNTGKGAKHDKIQTMNEDGVLEEVYTGLNSVDSVEQNDTTLLITSDSGKHKLAVYRNGKKSTETELNTNHFVSDYKSNTRLSKYGDVIFQRPVKSENSTGMKKLVYASLANISNETEISFEEASVLDAVFMDANNYFVAVAGKIMAFRNNSPLWTAGPLVSNIFLNEIQVDSRGKWLLAKDDRNGIFYVYDKQGGTVLHFDPYEKVSEELLFLEQKFPLDYENPLKTVYSGIKPKFDVDLDDAGTLIFKIEGEPRVYLLQLNKDKLETEYIEQDSSLIAFDYNSGTVLTRKASKLPDDSQVEIRQLQKKLH